MSPQTVWTLALCAGIAQGFQNTSPFFAFSDKDFNGNTAPGNFAKASSVREWITSDWVDCTSRDVFVVVSQPGVSAADYHSTSSAPYLRRSMSDWEHTQSKIAIPDVLGDLNGEDIANAISQKCGISQTSVDTSGPFAVQDQYPQVVTVELAAVSSDSTQRKQDLLQHDSVLNAVLEVTRPHSHSVFYLTSSSTTGEDVHTAKSHHSSHLSHHKHGSHKSPNAGDDPSRAHTQHALNPDALHIGLKRSISSLRRDEGNGSSDAALFERYNFLNKGVFMGGLITIILFSILYVGVSAVSSVEITPFAFSKEMGPQNQKKQQ